VAAVLCGDLKLRSATCRENAHEKAATRFGCRRFAPADSAVTAYDEEHLVTYLPILDAHEEGADWRDVARIVLQIDPERGPERARRSFESHLSRARWLTQRGYRASAARPASRIF
jgi:type VI secretion system activator RovC-like protein